MVFAYKGSGGVAQSSALNQTAATLTTTTTVGAMGDLAVLVVAVDNNATTDGDENAITSVTSGAKNIWLKAKEFTNGQAAIQAGATCGMWFCNLLSPIPVGTVITVNFGDPPARDASAFSLGYFTEASNFTAVVAATGALANDAQAAGSLDATTSNIAALRIRATASESNSTVLWTKTAAFDGLFAFAGTNSGGGAVNQGIRAEYDIFTGTGSPSLPTGGAGGATDHASVYVAFREVVTQTLSPTVMSDVDNALVPVITLYAYPGIADDPDRHTTTLLEASNAVSFFSSYDDVDTLFAPDVLRGAITLGAASIIDAEEILDVVVVPNAPWQVGYYEDNDIFLQPGVLTFWVINDVFVDLDDFTADTTVLSISYVRHAGIISIDELVTPGFVGYYGATSSGVGSDDNMFGMGVLSSSDADPDYHDDSDLFFAMTFSTGDQAVAPGVMLDNDFIHVGEIIGNVHVTASLYVDPESISQVTVTKGAVSIAPALVAADDVIYIASGATKQLFPALPVDVGSFFAPMLARGAVTLSPSRHDQLDNILTPMLSVNPTLSQRYVDPDLIPVPFITKRRAMVRSGVGVIEGSMDNVIALLGDRDMAA